MKPPNLSLRFAASETSTTTAAVRKYFVISQAKITSPEVPNDESNRTPYEAGCGHPKPCVRRSGCLACWASEFAVLATRADAFAIAILKELRPTYGLVSSAIQIHEETITFSPAATRVSFADPGKLPFLEGC